MCVCVCGWGGVCEFVCRIRPSAGERDVSAASHTHGWRVTHCKVRGHACVCVCVCVRERERERERELVCGLQGEGCVYGGYEEKLPKRNKENRQEKKIGKNRNEEKEQLAFLRPLFGE